MVLGELQTLEITRDSPHGWYLTDGDFDILLPNKDRPIDSEIGDSIQVFVYLDSSDRPIATTRIPAATVGKFAPMQVVSIGEHGAFFEWGLEKDLLCPFREQRRELSLDEVALVWVLLDSKSQRLIGSTRASSFVEDMTTRFDVGDEVEIQIAYLDDRFIEAIVNDRRLASLFPDEWYGEFQVGDRQRAFIKQVRDDGKIALSLRPQGRVAVLAERDRILQALRANNGYLPVSDRSSPAEIHRRFGLSKAAFKKLIGALFREGTIVIEERAIRLK